jgi:aryl-alcohol dehydrogenase-like predicted oxidoreductase
MVIATKGGLTRHGPNIWLPLGRPEYLRQCVLMSMRRLGIERIDLWRLHRIDPAVPRDEQFDCIGQMQKEGLIRHVGLSQAKIEEIEASNPWFKVASVQNRYNLVDRSSEDVLAYCEQHQIGFIPWYPLAAGSLAKKGSLLDTVAAAHGATPGQIALAWLLERSPVILPIPGTARVSHLEQNVGAAQIKLSGDQFAKLDREGQREYKQAATRHAD